MTKQETITISKINYNIVKRLDLTGSKVGEYAKSELILQRPNGKIYYTAYELLNGKISKVVRIGK
jgi:hypothetical protein